MSKGSGGGIFVAILLIVAGVGVGVLAANFGPLVLAGGVGLAIGYVMLTNPYAGILIITATLPLENAAVFGGATATRLVGVTVACGWLIGKLIRGESFRRVLSSPLTWFAFLFSFFALSSMLWAVDTSVVKSGFIQLVQLLVLMTIIQDVIEDWDQLQVLFRVLVSAGVVGAVITLWQSTQAGGIGRVGDSVAGVNGTAELLVTVMPFAFYLIISERSLLWRVMGAVYIGAGSAAVLATLSRFSIMLLPCVLGVMMIQTMRAGRGRGWLLAGFAAVTVAVFSQESSFERFEKRIESIAPYLSNTVQADEMGLSSRGFHLAVGLAMYKDNAFKGVGYNNFGYHFLYTYQYKVLGGNNLWQSRRSPHSSHIGILADLGSIGALLWFGILIAALGAVWRAGRLPVLRDDKILGTLGFAVLFAATLQAIPYGFYNPSQKSKLFWLLMSVCVVVWRLAQDSQEAQWLVEESEDWDESHEKSFVSEYDESQLTLAGHEDEDQWNRTLPGIR